MHVAVMDVRVMRVLMDQWLMPVDMHVRFLPVPREIMLVLVVFMGGMALGSILWGQVAARIGIPRALTAAAVGMVTAIALTWRFRLGHHQLRNFAIDGMAGTGRRGHAGAGCRPRYGDGRIPNSS